MVDEADKRKPRKKGQHTGSSSHSDLYTDENPEGTIKGLKFATIKDAEASVGKISKSGKSHAHKIQAAVAMEQRAKAAGKKTAAGVYRSYINSQKKDESLVRDYVRALLEFSIKANRKNVHQDGTSKSRGYMSGIDKTWTGEDTNDHLHNWYKKMGLMSEALLTESAVHPKIMKMIDKAEQMGLRVKIFGYGVKIYEVDGGTRRTVAAVTYEADPMYGPCLKSSIVNSAYGEEGLGPLAYDIAIEASGGLASDRTQVSDEAEAVWDYYTNYRKDVQVQQLDIDKYNRDNHDQLTPDDKDDDCEQLPAVSKYGPNWDDSGLSKKISKTGTPVIDELRKREMVD